MKISATVVADSKGPFGDRLTTLLVTMPRYILAEFNTHRMLSKNSASSRAIPFEKNVESVKRYTFIPLAWMKDHKGMQGSEYITDSVDISLNASAWLRARDNAISSAEYLNHGIREGRDNGVTKQLCNRLLEPFMYHTVICTATEWENFFALRCPRYDAPIFDTNGVGNKIFRSKKDALKETTLHSPTDMDWLKMNTGQADIHMMATAEAMWDAMNESVPKELKAREWHIPFGDDLAFEAGSLGEDADQIRANIIKIAIARCARVSYTVVGEEGKPANYENDIKLHDRLAASGHWSPFEHCAKVMTKEEFQSHICGVIITHTTPHPEDDEIIDHIEPDSEGWSGNFRGFMQYRKTFQNENITLNK